MYLSRFSSSYLNPTAKCPTSIRSNTIHFLAKYHRDLKIATVTNNEATYHLLKNFIYSISWTTLFRVFINIQTNSTSDPPTSKLNPHVLLIFMIFISLCRDTFKIFPIEHLAYEPQSAKLRHEIFETNSIFHVKQHSTGKSQYLFFRFLLTVTKFSFQGEEWSLSNNSMKVWDFPYISQFPKILSLTLIGNWWGNLYVPIYY